MTLPLSLVPGPDQAEPKPPICLDCERLAKAVYIIEQDLQNAEQALRTERRKNTMLQGQLDALLDESAVADEVKEIFSLWQGVTDHPRSKLLAERKKVIGKMLKHYGRDRCFMAVIGAHPEADGAYVNPKTGVRYDQISHIFGDEERFERMEAAGRRYCSPELAHKRRSTTIGQALKAAGMRFVDDEAMQMTHFKCPICHAADDDPLYYPLGITYDGTRGYCRECWAEIPDVLRAVGKTTLLEVAA